MKNNIIHFFGTTGDKELIFSNSRLCGGIYLAIDDVKIILDPGPGTFSSFLESYPGMITCVDAVILSHVHFDHSNDFNVFIEGMTDGGNNKRGIVFAPRHTLYGEDKIIHNYLAGFPEKIIEVEPFSEYVLKSIKVKSSVPHRHGVENYGYTFISDKLTITFMTDTVYFEGLAESYPKSDVLVINVPYASVPLGKKMKHLSLENLPHIIKCIKPQKVFLTHFGKSMNDADPDFCARRLSAELSCDINAVRDNQRYELL